MSSTSGITAKADKSTKNQKYNALDINTLYHGSKPEAREQKSAQPRTKHGMQSLGRVPTARRPPANLPSIKSESSGAETAVPLVPAGSSGWGSKTASATTPAAQTAGVPNSTPAPNDVNSNGPASQPIINTVSVQQTMSLTMSVESSTNVEKSWSGITAGTTSADANNTAGGFLHHQSLLFHQDFPKLSNTTTSATSGRNASGQQQPQAGGGSNVVDAQYGPGPCLRPQTEGSWTGGGGSSMGPGHPGDGPPSTGAGGGARGNLAPSAAPHAALGPAGLGPDRFATTYNPYRPLFPSSSQMPPMPSSRSGASAANNLAPRYSSSFHEHGPSQPPPISTRPIIKEEELNHMDELARDPGWAANNDIDYDQKLTFSDHEDSPVEEEKREKDIKRSDSKRGANRNNRASGNTGSGRYPNSNYPPPPSINYDSEEHKQVKQRVDEAVKLARMREEEEEKRYDESKRMANQKLHESENSRNDKDVSLMPNWTEKSKENDRDRDNREWERDRERDRDRDRGRTGSSWAYSMPPRFQKAAQAERNHQTMSRPNSNSSSSQSFGPSSSSSEPWSNKNLSNVHRRSPHSTQDLPSDAKSDYWSSSSSSASHRVGDRRMPPSASSTNVTDGRFQDRRDIGETKKQEDSARGNHESRQQTDAARKIDDDKQATASMSNSSSDHGSSNFNRPQRPDSRDSRGSSRDDYSHRSNRLWDSKESGGRRPHEGRHGPITRELYAAAEEREAAGGGEKRIQLKRGGDASGGGTLVTVTVIDDGTKQHDKTPPKVENEPSAKQRSPEDEGGGKAGAQNRSRGSARRPGWTTGTNFPRTIGSKLSAESNRRRRNNNKGSDFSDGSSNDLNSGVTLGGDTAGKRRERKSSRSKKEPTTTSQSESKDIQQPTSVSASTTTASKSAQSSSPSAQQQLTSTTSSTLATSATTATIATTTATVELVPCGQPSRRGRGGSAGGMRGLRASSRRIDGYGPPPDKQPFGSQHTEKVGNPAATEDCEEKMRMKQGGLQAGLNAAGPDGKNANSRNTSSRTHPRSAAGEKSKAVTGQRGGSSRRQKLHHETNDDAWETTSTNSEGDECASKGERKARGGATRKSAGSGRIPRHSGTGKGEKEETSKSEAKPAENESPNVAATEIDDSLFDADFQEVRSKKNISGGGKDGGNHRGGHGKHERERARGGGGGEKRKAVTVATSAPTGSTSGPQPLMSQVVTPPVMTPKDTYNSRNMAQRPRQQNALPPRMQKQLQQQHVQHSAPSGQTQAEVQDTSKVTSSFPVKAPEPTGNAWDKPLAHRISAPAATSKASPATNANSSLNAVMAQLALSDTTADGKQVASEDAVPPVNTIIFENTNLKSYTSSGPPPAAGKYGLATTQGPKRPSSTASLQDKSKCEDDLLFGGKTDLSAVTGVDSSVSDVSADATSASMQLPLYQKSDATSHIDAMKLSNFGFDTAELSMGDDKNGMPSDLGYKIASVKKVWDLGSGEEISSSGQQHGSSGNAASNAFGRFDEDSVSFATKQTNDPSVATVDECSIMRRGDVYSPSQVGSTYGIAKNESSSASKVCTVKPTQVVPSGPLSPSNPYNTAMAFPYATASGIGSSAANVNPYGNPMSNSTILSNMQGVSAIPSPPVLYNSSPQNLYSYQLDPQSRVAAAAAVAGVSPFAPATPYSLSAASMSGMSAASLSQALPSGSAFNQQTMYLQQPPPNTDLFPIRLPHSSNPFSQSPLNNNAAVAAATNQILMTNAASSGSSLISNINNINAKAAALGTIGGSKGITFQQSSPSPLCFPFEAFMQTQAGLLAGGSPATVQRSGPPPPPPPGAGAPQTASAGGASFYSTGTTAPQTGFYGGPAQTATGPSLHQAAANYNLQGAFTQPHMALQTGFSSQMSMHAAYRSQPTLPNSAVNQQPYTPKPSTLSSTLAAAAQDSSFSVFSNNPAAPQIPSPKSRTSSSGKQQQSSPTQQQTSSATNKYNAYPLMSGGGGRGPIGGQRNVQGVGVVSMPQQQQQRYPNPIQRPSGSSGTGYRGGSSTSYRSNNGPVTTTTSAPSAVLSLSTTSSTVNAVSPSSGVSSSHAPATSPSPPQLTSNGSSASPPAAIPPASSSPAAPVVQTTVAQSVTAAATAFYNQDDGLNSLKHEEVVVADVKSDSANRDASPTANKLSEVISNAATGTVVDETVSVIAE